VRVATRQAGAGSQILLGQLLAEAGLGLSAIVAAGPPALTQTDLALAVQEGRADAGLAVAAAARQAGLDFVQIAEERFDLVLGRRAAFEPPFQRLMAITHTASFAARAAAMTGYDVTEVGTVVYNGP
jgi:molybdate-binding protein